MPFSVREEYNAVVFEIKGRFLGSVDGTDFKERLASELESGRKQIVVDMSKTEFMDSSGIGVLISGLTSAKRAGGDMRLAGMTKRIKNLFLITKLLGPVFKDYGEVEDAIKSFQNDSTAGG